MSKSAVRTKADPGLFMWAGGKGKMLRHYAPLLPADVARRSCVEPFAGGAALFNHLSTDRTISATLSDINAELMDLYRLVRDDPEFLISECLPLERAWMDLDIAARKALYYRLRAEYWAMPEGPGATARLFFLMKTAFNGIWQTCRASGGRFGTPVGLATQKARVFEPETVRLWARKMSGAALLTGNFEDVPVPDGAFVFCDPPYRDSFTSYGTAFDDARQIALIAWCREVHAATGSVVWLSNRDAGDGFFERHAPEARLHRFPVTYTAGRRKRVADGFAAKTATELLVVWS